MLILSGFLFFSSRGLISVHKALPLGHVIILKTIVAKKSYCQLSDFLPLNIIEVMKRKRERIFMKYNQTKAIVVSLIIRVIWGISFLFTRTIVVRIHYLNLLSWRFFIAFLAFSVLIVFKVFKINLKGKKIAPLIAIAMAEPLAFFMLESIGLYRTSAVETGLIFATAPIAAMIIGIPITKQIPTRKQIFSIMLTVGGVLVIILDQSMGGIEFDAIGYITLFAAVFSAALAYSLSAKHSEYTSVEKTFVMMLVGCVGYGITALTRNLALGTMKEWLVLPLKDREFLIAVLYLGVLASVVCYVGQNYCLAVIGLNRHVSFTSLTTLTTVFTGVLVLDENLTFSMIIGGIIILVGVYGANYFTPQKIAAHKKRSKIR